MNKKISVAIGITLSAIVLFIDQYITFARMDAASYFLSSVMLVLLLTCLAYGAKLPLWYRVFATACFFIRGTYNAVFGRANSPYLSLDTFLWCLFAFAFLSFFYIYPMRRIWTGAIRKRILLLFPIVSIVMALIIVSIEETAFKHIYAEGSGPRARWTININWLSYDPEEGFLRGAD